MLFARRLFRVTTTLLLSAGVLLGALMVVPALFGIQRYVIVSGSMTGSYDRGSVVFDQVVPTASLKVGDVITYRPPAGAGPDHLITHRISAITTDRSGGRVFRTKGDANAVADPWTFTLPNATQARVRAGLPYVGFAIAALSDRRVRMLVIGLPAALIAFSSLAGLWRDTSAEPAGARA
jgi:signal peptidase